LAAVLAVDSSLDAGDLVPADACGFLVVILVVISACYRYERSDKKAVRRERGTAEWFGGNFGGKWPTVAWGWHQPSAHGMTPPEQSSSPPIPPTRP
jgi:hypothetical protein